MNAIVKIHPRSIDCDSNSVDARELHSFIQAKQQFSHWVKNRINKYGFIENKDYIIVHTKRTGNNATLIEYYITLDMAKELCMVENNDKGREARRYFIEIEKKIFTCKQSKPPRQTKRSHRRTRTPNQATTR